MKQEPPWYRGTEQCVETNLHQMSLGAISKLTAKNQIMAHIQTLLIMKIKNIKDKPYGKMV
jgi:hypothetical protein